MLAKIISISSRKISVLHTKLCTIPCNTIRKRTTIEFWIKRDNNAPYKLCIRSCIIVISNNTYFAYKLLCNFNHQKSRPAYSNNFEKMKLRCHLLSDFHQKVIDINLCLYNTKYKISSNSEHWCLSYSYDKIFGADRKQNADVPVKSNLVQDIPKSVNP